MPAAYAEGALLGDDLHAVIRQAELRRPLVVAWSMGGLVTGHYLVRHGTDGIAGVNLVDAVTSFAPGLLTTASAAFGPRLANPDLAVRSDAVAALLSDCFAARPTWAAFDRMLAKTAWFPAPSIRAWPGSRPKGWIVPTPPRPACCSPIAAGTRW